MKPVSRALGLLCTALLTQGMTLAVSGQEPSYVDLLRLPVAGDRIQSPAGVALDPGSGEIFVVDQRGQRLLVFDGEGLFRFEIGGGDVFSSPGDLAIDGEGFLYLVTVASGRRGSILQLDFDGEFIRELQLKGVPDDLESPQVSSLSVTPDGSQMAIVDGRNGYLWLTDREAKVVTGRDLREGLEEKERDDLRLGQVDIYGEKVLVAIPSVGEVRCFDLRGRSCGIVSSGRGGHCGMLAPMAAGIDSDGNYIIVDQQRMMLLRWNPGNNKCLGQYYGFGNAPGYLYFPHDLVLDAAGRLYVAQTYEGRVQVYDGLSPASGLAPE